MNLANYICDLLYRYECVIVPKFGGFVTNNKSARIDASKHTIFPPYKQITFNAHLKNNDGLLANYIASVDNISYECALNYIQFEIDAWKEKLKSQDLSLYGLGTFNFSGDQLLFEPQQAVNYLTSSFGLSSIASSEIERESMAKAVTAATEAPIPKVIPIVEKKAPNYLKYAAIFVIGLSAIGFAGKYYQGRVNEKEMVEAQKRQDLMEEKIENATFIISKPLPTLHLEVESSTKNFHVIAGAFRFPENADRKLNQLLQEGYNARILGVNKWNLTVVSYGSFSSRNEALETLSQIKKNVAKDSWLLIQNF